MGHLKTVRSVLQSTESCPRCGSTQLAIEPCTEGPHDSKALCGGCGRFLRWLPKPWTWNRAERFTMPYGRFAGRTIGDLSRSVQTRSYVRWLARYGRGTPAKAARIVLLLEPAEVEG